MSGSSESLEAGGGEGGGGRKREREGVHGGRGRYALWRNERAGERRVTDRREEEKRAGGRRSGRGRGGRIGGNEAGGWRRGGEGGRGSLDVSGEGGQCFVKRLCCNGRSP